MGPNEIPIQNTPAAPEQLGLKYNTLGLHAVVKNTFIHWVEPSENEQLRRSASESDISKSSESGSQPSRRSGPGDNPVGESSATASGPKEKSSATASSSSNSASANGLGDEGEGGADDTQDEFIWLLHGESGVPISQLRKLDRLGILRRIPKNDEGELTSVGSVPHASGDCVPCLFWFRKSCSRGLHCNYCHFTHQGQRNKRIRPSKQTRLLRKSDARSDDNGDCTDNTTTSEDGFPSGTKDEASSSTSGCQMHPPYVEIRPRSVGPVPNKYGAPWSNCSTISTKQSL